GGAAHACRRPLTAFEDSARERCRAPRQRSPLVIEHELGELLGEIVLAGFEPVHRDLQLGCELAECMHARFACVGFDAADVGVADAWCGEVALAEAEFESSLPDAPADRAHVRAERTAVHRCLVAKPSVVVASFGAGGSASGARVVVGAGSSRPSLKSWSIWWPIRLRCASRYFHWWV